MPTYVYRREDGTTFELEQRITEPALEVDPETGQKVQRVITGSAGLVFKGSGFYLTDYARQSGGKETTPKETSSESSGDSKATDTSDKKSDSATTSGSSSKSTSASDD